MGMSPTDFWEGNPYYTLAYLDAENKKLEKKNTDAHRQGYYNYMAFNTVMSFFGWNMGGRKGAKPEGYLEYPIAITENEKKAEKKRNIEKTLRWIEQGQKGV